MVAGARTVTDTAAEVAVPPALSTATACTEYVPGVSGFHAMLYGETVTWLNRTEPW